MPITRRTLGLAAMAGAALPSMARAQAAYPTRPISWIVPFNAGGVTDTNSRFVSSKLSQRLGKPIVIENRPGAGGTLGTEHASRAAADGHTILYGTNAAMSIAPSLYRRLGYDPMRSFVAVHALFESPNVIVVNPNRPYRTLSELVAYAKANPGKVNLAHAGVGTSTHLSAVLFESAAGIETTHVGYTGASTALTDVVAGNVDLLFDYVVSSRPHVQAGRLRALAVTSRERVRTMPELPTAMEQGYPDIITSNWSGIFVPAGTPSEVVRRLATETAAVLREPEVGAMADSMGSRVASELNGEAFSRFVEQEMARWGEIVRRSGAQPA